nr:ribonuclease H-like domain-containing protein [Tanacetum cinerariifolium]
MVGCGGVAEKTWEVEFKDTKPQPEKTYNDDLECEMVMVKVPRCMSRLDAHNEPICDLNTMEDEVENASPQSTSQVLPSLKVYTPLVIYSEKVDETCNHGLFLSSKGVPSVEEPEAQPLPNFLTLDVNLGEKRGTDPPINKYSLGSFRMKVVEPLTIYVPPSPHVLDDMIELPKSQPKKTYKEDLECDMVMVKVPRCMLWLDVHDEPIGDLNTMEDKVENPSPQSTPQVLPLFEVYTPPVIYPEEVDETCNHGLFLSSKGVPSVDEPEAQPVSNFPPLDVNLGDKTGTDPPINQYSLGSRWMKEDLESEMVVVKVPRCMSWLDAHDEHIGDLNTMEDEVENPSPQSTPQVLPSFEEFLKKEKKFFIDLEDGVRNNPDGVIFNEKKLRSS